MARVLQIYDQTDSVDLVNGYIQVIWSTWTTQDLRDGKVLESFDVLVKPGNDWTVVTEIEDLNKLAYRARDYHDDRLRPDPVWLRGYSTVEEPKRALVFDIIVTNIHELGHAPEILGMGGAALYNVAITRLAAWEGEDLVSYGFNIQDKATIGQGGAVAAPGGSLPPRMEYCSLYGSPGYGEVNRAWIGIRPTYKTVTGFTPIIEAEGGFGAGVTVGTDAITAADVTASNNLVVAVDFATTTTNAKRVGMNFANIPGISGTGNEYIGRYHILLRCKLSAAQEVMIQLRAGLINSTNGLTPCQAVPFSDTNWRIVDLGEVQVPSVSRPLSTSEVLDVENIVLSQVLEIWVERLGTAVTLSLDYVALVPAEHFLFVDNVRIFGDASSGYTGLVVCKVFPDNEVLVIGRGTSLFDASPIYTLRDWTIPPDGGYLVMVGERTSSHVLADKFSIEVNYAKRFRTHNDEGGGT